MKYLHILFLLLYAAPSLAADSLLFTCERSEMNYTETYELKVTPASKKEKAKVFIDDRDLDLADELGRQTIKSVLITESTVLISMEAHFPPESFDGVQYGAGSVITAITINRATGQLRKAETVKGGILSATLGEGSKTYQEQCTAAKKP
ncbi:hypothetical protein [Polynucleobacter sp. 78F-HAINBA]|uniref:hypothetical protein n=1 Tax=Polynucleobacter sp. 78F-HAINBA TaxID=2689099 RepID=UPI001C0E6867|nr:hypothetical protein [Polynucleobacter sp. 78F-HAINBA]